jgi:hypothetical protein
MKPTYFFSNKIILAFVVFFITQLPTALVAQTAFSAVSNGLPDAYRMDVADLENDGDLDVVAVVYEPELFYVVKVYTNDGSGNFTNLNPTGLTHPLSFSLDVAFIDIEGDNDQDILVINSSGSALYRNDGGGTFTQLSGTPFLNLTHTGIAIGDLDNDNDEDILVLGNSNIAYLGIFINDGSGNFTASGTSFLAGYRNSVPVIGELNGDNINDFVISNYGGDGPGISYTSPINIPTSSTDDNMILVDVDTDSDLDIVIDDNINTIIILNDGSGNFTQSSVTLAGAGFGALVAGDIDKDGDQDIYRRATNSGGTVYEGGFYINDGGGNFYLDSSITTVDIPSAEAFLVDLNGDTNLDLLLADRGATFGKTYYYQNDFATFSHPDRALYLDSINLYNANYDAALNTLPMTVEFWIQQPSGDVTQGILDKISGNNGFTFTQVAHNILSTYEVDGSNLITGNAGLSLSDGNWHHIALVVESTGAKFYGDGVLLNTFSWTGTAAAISNTQGLRIGRTSKTSSFFKGNLDELRIWNSARTQAEIIANYCNTITNPTNNANLVAYYSMNDYLDSTAVIFDQSKNHNPITISGGTQTLVAENGSCSAPALPVELVYFKGEHQNGKNILTWQTASEENNDGFYIEKSANGTDWETIGFVQGSGTTTDISNYEFTDNRTDVLVKRLYYRLKQVDYDGNFEYSNILNIEYRTRNIEYRIFPNPVKDVLTIEINTPTTIQIVNTYGQVLLEQHISNTEKLNVSHLSNGIYFVKVGQQTYKFTVQK